MTLPWGETHSVTDRRPQPGCARAGAWGGSSDRRAPGPWGSLHTLHRAPAELRRLRAPSCCAGAGPEDADCGGSGRSGPRTPTAAFLSQPPFARTISVKNQGVPVGPEGSHVEPGGEEGGEGGTLPGPAAGGPGCCRRQRLCRGRSSGNPSARPPTPSGGQDTPVTFAVSLVCTNLKPCPAKYY